LRWYPGITAGCAPRSASAKLGLALEADPKRVGGELEQCNIFPATLNTEVSGPNGNVSSAPVKERQ
jgi:hypothetical protein